MHSAKLNDIFNGDCPTYILVRRLNSVAAPIEPGQSTRGIVWPVEMTLFPEPVHESADKKQYYLEFQMKYDVPMMEAVDWRGIRKITSLELAESNALKAHLKTIRKYTVYATYKVYKPDGIINRQELVYFGPSKAIAEKIKKYIEDKYKMEDKTDFILAKYSGVRDVEFIECCIF